MLPFPKRKAREEDIVELDDEDLVLVDPPARAPGPAVSGRDVPGSAAMSSSGRMEIAVAAPRASRPAFSRKALDEALEDDVIGECLASISATTARSRSSMTPLTLPAPPPPRPSSPPSSASRISASRLPAVSPPPFVRTSSTSLAGSGPSVFSHTPAPPASSAAAYPCASSSAASLDSIAPASFPSLPPAAVSSRPPEPTVIVLREKPRAGWIAASAIVGAAFAVLLTKVLAGGASDAPANAPAAAPVVPVTAPVTAPANAPALTSAAVVTAPAPGPAPLPALDTAQPVAQPAAAPAPALTVKFDEDDAVSIPPVAAPRKTADPAPASSGAPAAKPKPKAAPRSPGPTLPDGSYSLGARAEASPASTGAPATAAPQAAGQASGQQATGQSAQATAPASSPSAAPRKLTPEQELAAAQLKASMR